MNKFLHTLYDITDEATSGNIQKLAEFIDGVSVSSSARNAKIPSIEEMDELPADNCALTLFVSGTGEIKKFAHHRPELAELNIAMLLKNHAQLPDEICKIASYNLSRAAARFELDFPEELVEITPVNAPTSLLNVDDINELDYMRKLARYRDSLESKKDTGSYALPGKKKRYPLHDESYIKTACAYFEKYQHEFKAIDKLAFCKNTQAAGDREDVQIEGSLTKFAELDETRLNPNFVLHIKNRQKLLAGNEDAVQVYDELLEKSAEFTPEKTAEALEAVDKKFKVHKHWGDRIEEPLLSTLSPFVKEASIYHDGVKISSSSFSSLRGRDLNGIVDTYTLDELTSGTPESLDVFQSLPMPIKDALVEKLSDE